MFAEFFTTCPGWIKVAVALTVFDDIVVVWVEPDLLPHLARKCLF